jgi:hypothetical protein
MHAFEVIEGRYGRVDLAGVRVVIAGKKAVFEGPLRVPIEMPVKGRRSHVRIPEKLEVDLVPLRHRVSQAEREVHEVHMVYPAGTGGFGDDGDIAMTTTMRVNHGILACQPPDRWVAYAMAAWTNQP